MSATLVVCHGFLPAAGSETRQSRGGCALRPALGSAVADLPVVASLDEAAGLTTGP